MFILKIYSIAIIIFAIISALAIQLHEDTPKRDFVFIFAILTPILVYVVAN